MMDFILVMLFLITFLCLMAEDDDNEDIDDQDDDEISHTKFYRTSNIFFNKIKNFKRKVNNDNNC